MTHQSAKSVNLQIRILLGLTLLLLAVLAVTKVIQTATFGERLRTQADVIEAQKERIDNLEMRVTGGLGTGGQTLGLVPTGGDDELMARLRDLEEQNSRLNEMLAQQGAGADSGSNAASGSAPASPGSGASVSGGLPRDLGMASGGGTGAPAPPSFEAPASPEEQQLEILRRRMRNEQAVGTVGSVAPDGSFVVFEPMPGIDLIGGDKVLVGRETPDGPEPVATLLIDTRDPDSGLYVADVLPEDRDDVSGSVLEDDSVFLLDGQ